MNPEPHPSRPAPPSHATRMAPSHRSASKAARRTRVARNPDGSVAAIDNPQRNVTVDRDGEGVVTGVTVTEL